MTEDRIEVSVKGQWVRSPAIDVNGQTIVVTGKVVRIATIHDEAWLETELEDPQACVQALRQQRSGRQRADIFSFSQKLPATVPKYTYYMEWESLAAIYIPSFKEWWDALPQEARKNVRRSQKRGVVIQVRECCDDVIRGLVDLNNDSPIRQGRANRHYGKTFEQVKKDYASFLDRSDLVCAYVGDELVGLLKVVYRGGIASILQCLPKASHYDKRPANALIAKAVELCAAKGISYLTYGLFNYGSKRGGPLLEFKVRNGFQEILVPRYYVALTKWGHLCVRLRFHRGMRGILPDKILEVAITTREKWHNFKQWVNRCRIRVTRGRQTVDCLNPSRSSDSQKD